MILTRKTNRWQEYKTDSFISMNKLLEILKEQDEFKEDLISLYNINVEETKVLKIGNAKFLVEDINLFDTKCRKIDITTKVKDIQLKKLLEEEKAIFEIFNISDNFLLKKNRTNILEVETRYSAKSDLLDYYKFSKFANYCRDNEFDDLVDFIKNYLKRKNIENNDSLTLRLLFDNEIEKFFLRAVTSQEYKNFGINFSVFVALITLNEYVERTRNEIFIDHCAIDDSNIYVSFSLNQKFNINNELKLSFNLILENDEIKRNAVSFNGVFKLTFDEKDRQSQIFLKPKGIKKENTDHYVDLLTYPHRGSVENVMEKIKELPTLIDYFIEQVKKDAETISRIKHPNDIKELILSKVKFARNDEFKAYKQRIQTKLASITVDNMFKLFELLREVEELFEHDDIVSKNYWRTKLYEAMTKKED